MKGKLGLKKERSSQRIALKTSFSRFKNTAENPLHVEADNTEDGQQSGSSVGIQPQHGIAKKANVGGPVEVANVTATASTSKHGVKRNRGASVTEKDLIAKKGLTTT
ncbi:uncharacterized protein LOC143571281 [Bidens hawaiensis]|uniref:uncharacterized protein LOC143571281 n=1 Tax=Bidens hawaiensis TaxID=980011 RepID=UPI00404B406F